MTFKISGSIHRMRHAARSHVVNALVEASQDSIVRYFTIVQDDVSFRHSYWSNSCVFTIFAHSGISTLLGSSRRRYHLAVTSSFVNDGSIK